MSPNAVPCSSESAGESAGPARGEARFSVPGKVFLLGEYAVLSGHPAVLATLGPRFRLTLARDGETGSPGQTAPGQPAEYHPRSPAGRLLEVARARGVAVTERCLRFEDSFRGEGGFGASTAQFALLYGALARETGWEPSALSALRVYRELMADERLPPSGADLVAQWSGGVVRFDPARGEISQRFGALDWRDLLVFSAAGQPGRKVPTHEHLATLALAPGLAGELSGQLARVIDRGDRALQRQDAVAFGQAMSDYARCLCDARLELDAARADREALCALPGVLGAKGAGALLADAVVVLLEPRSSRRASVIDAARARGLRLVADGLGSQAQAGFAGPAAELPEPEAGVP